MNQLPLLRFGQKAKQNQSFQSKDAKGIEAVAGSVCMECVLSTQVEGSERTMDSREIIRELKADGWFEVAHVGSHKQFKHATKRNLDA
jgi:hypothetical protein